MQKGTRIRKVLGAFWYFFSIERETTCWHMGCKPDAGCSKTSFNCGHGSSSDTTILNKFCSLENPNTTLFDFGIFQEARQSRILESMDFPRKTIFCFWWGLRNLSSFGQNLETSSYYWENCFTVLISIFGLLLFLYFIGNLQVYMQWEAQKEMEELSMHKPSKEVKETSKHKHDAISKQTSKERNEISKEHDEISKLLKVIYKEHDEISKLLEVIYKEHDDISKLLEVISKEHNEISKLLKIRPLPPVYMQWEAQKEMKDIYEDKKDEISKEHDEISKLVEASDI
ncbi:cyclic nucleotide-gated ion channel 1-like isoform X2 [Carya illinoinensis]|uniref:cyclic nucleotide-gated ion channel 1-like isoform X2 n=1 Tax=Carya illinoinensis TaxID=32201 RepID=UPI001C729950|nr:cyclic nucleotide-gated ion channel 1-like isoform X2 [Carya illinoinensis]